MTWSSGVTGWGWGNRPGWHHPADWHSNESINIFGSWTYKNTGQTIDGKAERMGGVGVEIKRWLKSSSLFEVNKRVTPSVTTNLSDATNFIIFSVAREILNHFAPLFLSLRAPDILGIEGTLCWWRVVTDTTNVRGGEKHQTLVHACIVEQQNCLK